MKRVFGALLALVCAVVSAPAFAAPPTFNLDSPPPPGAAILYCVNTASGPPYIAYPCDATHPVQTSGGGGGAITGNVGVLNTGSTQIDPATSGKQDTGNTSLSAIATSTAAGSTAANQAAIQAPIAPATATATKAVAIGCQYNSTTITPTDGQQFIIQCGPRGGLNVGGSVASGAADGGNPVKTGGVYNSSAPTVTNGQRVDDQRDQHGSEKALLVDGNGAALDPTQPTQTYEGYAYTNITTKTNTRLTAAAGHQLARILINKIGTADTITVKDSAASDCSGGTTVGTITVQSAVPAYPEGWTSTAGICLVTGGTTAGDYTAIWR